ncbi:glycosyltransferase [Myxococcus stipitatus]|uniref:glycosyltransferase n=1 Tax=Myxococcus stipitatus TaxID=83455 RepID=UPI002DD42CE9|nr:glycosyltransferase [Myxococcus stipitatus]
MPASSPRFSIVVPCFNQGTFLAACLRSLRAQTLPPREIIVVDDGSTDAATLRALEEQCVEGVRLVRQEHRGLAGARNTGIRAATGEWVVPLDVMDELPPEALATYARAIAGAPEVDVWLPDAEFMGLEQGPRQRPCFNAWRQLLEAPEHYGAAVRRAVFDSGVLYDEQAREDGGAWELLIHACVEHGFVARNLEAPALRYRVWGHDRFQARTLRAARAEALSREHPFLQDAEALTRVKRQHAPYLGVATQSQVLAHALGNQHFQDFLVVDDTGRASGGEGLGVFQDVRCARALVSLEDTALALAARADDFLLEKVARTLHHHPAALMWLVTTPADMAWPGAVLTGPEARAPSVRCVGYCLSPRALVDAPAIPQRGDNALADLAHHVERLAPQATLTLVVGTHQSPSEGVALPEVFLETIPAEPSAAVPSNTGRQEQLLLGMRLLGKSAARLSQATLSPDVHSRLLHSRLGDALRARLAEGARPAPVVAPSWPGPLSSARLGEPRMRELHLWAFEQAPRFAPALAPDAGAVLVVLPSLASSRVGQSRARLVRELARLEPHRRLHVLVTREEGAGNALAADLLPHVASAWCLASLESHPKPEDVARLAAQLGVGAVLIADSRIGYDAIPALRKLPRRLRLVAQSHGIQMPVSQDGPVAPCAHVAGRFNNLLDAYAVTSHLTAEQLARDFYVSASKVHVVPPVVEVPRAEARRARVLAEDATPHLLWYTPTVVDDGTQLLLLELMQLWHQRHAHKGPHFIVVTPAEERGWLPRALESRHLLDRVSWRTKVTGDWSSLFADADAVILPTPPPEQPLLVLEAMAAGVPVIASSKAPGMSPELTAQLAWVLENPSRAVDYVRALEYMLDVRETTRVKAEGARAFSATWEPATRHLLELLTPPPVIQSMR